MINCNQCGKINATGAVKCQSCGAPLSNMVDGGMSPRSASLQQPELPAWLESLRAGERSPANTEANFSTADFVDENSLPSWMRAERNETRDNTGANPPVSVRPSSLPGPTTDGEHQPPTGIAARSLLDEQALPSWMQEGQQSNPISAQEKIAASSLVQSESMPDWMKSLQRDKASFPGEMGGGTVPSGLSSTSSQMSTPRIPATPQQSAGGSQSASLPAYSGQAGFSAGDLIDPQALPSWMVQQSNVASSGQRNQGSSAQMPASSPMPSQSASSPAHSGQAGFSARDLIDPQALPSWMVQQGERAGQPAHSSQVSQTDAVRGPGQPAQGQALPASSLLDPNSLPAWLRENEQGGRTQGQSSPLANQSFQAPSTTPPSAFGGNVPASSFLDINSVPEWMQQVDPQQQNNRFGSPAQHGSVTPPVPGAPQQNVYTGPPRVENMRVPNRPRNEINPGENSEAAANVFSSMLGVASSTPNYPVPSSQPHSSYQGFSGNPVQPNRGYPMGQSGMPPSGHYAGSSMGAMPNTPSISSNTPQGYTPSSSYQEGMSSSQMSNRSSASVSRVSNSTTPPQRMEDAANEQKNAKRRGLFGAILDWLTH